jgi:hypothetical protein
LVTVTVSDQRSPSRRIASQLHIIRDRKPPIGARYVVGNLDLAVLCCFVERVLEGIDEECGDY